jgi:hypothetical protein
LDLSLQVHNLKLMILFYLGQKLLINFAPGFLLLSLFFMASSELIDGTLVAFYSLLQSLAFSLKSIALTHE